LEQIVVPGLAVVGALMLVWWGYKALVPELVDIAPERISSDDGDHRPAEALVAHLGVPLLEGNRVELLVNGDEIFPAMLSAIDDAAQSINLLSYIYWRGDIAQRFADALSAAAQRGVTVRVVLDTVGALRMDAALVLCMEEPGASSHGSTRCVGTA
jgi:cardiolipin synthase A/B